MNLSDSPVVDNLSSWFTEEYADMTPFQNSFSNVSGLGVSPVIDTISSWLTEEYADMIPFPNSSSDDSNEYHFYGEYFVKYNAFYAPFHGYISLTICCFGIIASIMNIIVLTRQNMSSPMNTLFTGLAVADMTVMLTTVPFNIHYYIIHSPTDLERYIYGWAVYEIVYNHLVLVNHTISIWITVTVAIWRYMAVCHPAQTANWLSLKRAKISTVVTYIICYVFCIPMYFKLKVGEAYDKKLGILYDVVYSDAFKSNNNLFIRINFWIFSVVIKLVPCIALSGLSFLLVRALCKSNIRRNGLKLEHMSPGSRDRITSLLLVVLLLFMIAEFPYGILALLTAILGQDFLYNVYLNLLETLEDIVLINCAVNFIIYCSMSKQFRETFASLFLTRWRRLYTSARAKMHPMETAQMQETTRF